jgi:hypothetical protein
MKTFLITAIMFWANATMAQTIYVNAAASTNGNGSSWAMAYNNLHDAIAQANSSRPIWLAKGNYYPTADSTGNSNPSNNRSKVFYIAKDLSIIGGFAGTETLESQANPIANPTVISGDISMTPTDSTDNTYHAILISNHITPNGITAATVIKNVTITDTFGWTNPVTTNENIGGAILFQAVGVGKSMSPVFENVIFNKNYARIGGAMYFNIWGSTVEPVFRKCIFTNNIALGVNNAIPNGSGGVVRFNTNGNGALCAAKIDQCLFENNRAGFAGTIYNILYGGNSYIEISNSYFIKNRAASNGGVMYNCSNGTTVQNKPIISNTVFSENSGGTIGGVIYNLANQGENSVTLLQCTFSNNTAATAAVAMYSRNVIGAGVSNSMFKNCIIWNNTTANNETINSPSGNSTITMDHSIVTDGTIDSTFATSQGNIYNNCIEANPLFNNPADLNGPDNQWRTPDDGLNIQPSSPGLDAGDNTVVNTALRQARVAAIATDITGVTNRIINNTVDLGGFEYFTPTALPLQLIDFQVNNKNKDLHFSWTTAHESNLASFEIQQSYNAGSFETIAQISPNNQAEKNFYKHSIPNNNIGEAIIYYRLKITENNQNNSYSAIKYLHNTQENQLKFGPNPVGNQLNFFENNNQPQTLTLLNHTGQAVLNHTTHKGHNTLNTSLLPAGTYYLRQPKGQTIKLIKQ